MSISLSVTAASSDTWVNVANSTYCSVASNDCAKYGYCELHTQEFRGSSANVHVMTDDPSGSRSSSWESNNFGITYVGGDEATGSWFTDTITIGSSQIYSAQFAIANESYNNEGILGLGYLGDESTTTDYPNFPYLLYQKHIIDCIAW